MTLILRFPRSLVAAKGNGAARRAVNSIISDSKSKSPYCKVYKMRMPWIFKIYRWFDQRRYNIGLPWSGKIWN